MLQVIIVSCSVLRDMFGGWSCGYIEENKLGSSNVLAFKGSILRDHRHTPNMQKIGSCLLFVLDIPAFYEVTWWLGCQLMVWSHLLFCKFLMSESRFNRNLDDREFHASERFPHASYFSTLTNRELLGLIATSMWISVTNSCELPNCLDSYWSGWYLPMKTAEQQ